MWNEAEAPPARRLVAFAAIFLGLFALSSANFAGEVPLISPPLVALIVILAAGAGLMIWVKPRISRALLWLAAGLALVASAGSALLFGPIVGVAYILVLLALDALVGAVIVAIGLFRPPLLAKWARAGRWTVIIAALLLLLVAAPAGRGPLLGVLVAGAALGAVALLRPDQQD